MALALDLEYFPDPLTQCIRQRLELVTLTDLTKTIQDRVTTTIEILPIQQPHKRPDCFNRDGLLGLLASLAVTHQEQSTTTARRLQCGNGTTSGGAARVYTLGLDTIAGARLLR